MLSLKRDIRIALTGPDVSRARVVHLSRATRVCWEEGLGY